MPPKKKARNGSEQEEALAAEPKVASGPVVKGYVCNRYPQLRITKRIQFESGLFTTDDPELQALVEKNDLWGLHIHPR